MLEIPYIIGDGVGPEVVKSMIRIIDAATDVCNINIKWISCPMGVENYKYTGHLLPQSSIDILKDHEVSIKGPLQTPVGEGHRSLNVTLRQELDLYACVRPVKYYTGIDSPIKHPEVINMTVFRENTEDVYAGIEFDSEDSELYSIIATHGYKDRVRFPDTSSYAIKPISIEGSERLVRAACEYAMNTPSKRLTLVHKGNIMKQTEGLFLNTGLKIAKDYPDLKVDNCICDAFMQNAILNPSRYGTIATTNLNGDYISDMLAAMVGGIGISPGANINYNTNQAIFEATHGTAPDIAGKNIVNPCSCILSGVMMLRHLRLYDAADLIEHCLSEAIREGNVTQDLSKNYICLTTEEFTNLIIQKIYENY